MSKIDLVGYVRKDSKNSNDMKITLSVKALDIAQRHLSQDGEECITVVARIDKIQEIIDVSRDVTSVIQIVEA